MKLSQKEVKHIALLARLGLSEEETEQFRGQISNILDNFEILREVDTADVPPTSQVTGLLNITADDEPVASFSQEEILANAALQENGYFRIRAVLE
ncbi:MAG: Asp-tRNA(Asn)/Glu-tRNA(Gln) amidotransferase subunit GatC [Chloroflexota bacterium]|nr:Asp-tRNA(Asn)/Glu-tRNA(Gln) amidotransferase subunit GatC [Chloroflexota bacterium]